ncbi:hypothetical protein GON03_23285 [Nocardioides sp. MAH-18]|uniref:Uncharacterized protein n=1 Tax=Nocardioides agri TaxID=2682843 RepID=A0A6L6XZQ4_9ACTN|nr:MULTISPECIES: DUF5994 family protein [unclassified Nocardioides]MBA2952955.1 hypothetical protein [Nocardioides sp. CGMCC 1.13656]MVQ52117.1 hypothetical protein [Nocardioides sp. MAH-18]
MSTSNESIAPTDIDPPSRVPLRLAMAEHSDQNWLDGGWWPQSRDLAVELADLVHHFPAQHGRIVRALYSPPDWEPAPRRIPVRGGYVKVGSFPRDDSHLIHLTTSDRTVLRVLVVPPGFTEGQGAEALLAAATAGNAHSAADLLHEVTDNPDADPTDRWADGGESWWDEGRVAPSFRTGG